MSVLARTSIASTNVRFRVKRTCCCRREISAYDPTRTLIADIDGPSECWTQAIPGSGCVFASCAQALRSSMIGYRSNCAISRQKQQFRASRQGHASPSPALAENESRRAGKSSCVNLTELNDEDRHQSYVRFRPNAFGRRTEPLLRGVFCRPN